MKLTLRKISTGLGALTIGVAIALTASSPAHATVAECETFLAKEGYTVGDGVRSACRTGAPGGKTAHLKCTDQLKALGVEGFDASYACSIAAR